MTPLPPVPQQAAYIYDVLVGTRSFRAGVLDFVEVSDVHGISIRRTTIII